MSYLTKRYAHGIESLNRGGLTLVTDAVFGWAQDLLRVVRYNFDQSTITYHGNECIHHAWVQVESNTRLVQRFNDEWPLMMKNDPSLMENLKIRDKIRNTLISKVFHARTECEFKIYKQNNTDRGADQQGQCTLREFLKVIAGTGVYGEKSEGAEGPTEEECKEDRQYIDEQDLHGRRAKVAKHMENRDGIRKLIFN